MVILDRCSGFEVAMISSIFPLMWVGSVITWAKFSSRRQSHSKAPCVELDEKNSQSISGRLKSPTKIMLCEVAGRLLNMMDNEFE